MAEYETETETEKTQENPTESKDFGELNMPCSKSVVFL